MNAKPTGAALAAVLSLAACNADTSPQSLQDAAATTADGDRAIPGYDWQCGWPDPQCRNAVLWRDLQLQWKTVSPWQLENALGIWKVVTAVRADGQGVDSLWSSVDARDARFDGSQVRIGREEILFEPALDGLASTDPDLPEGTIYPHCTKPVFDGDLRNSASAMRDMIEPWRRFGLRREEAGRYFMIACTGGPDFPHDGDGHAAEVTVEEAYGPTGLYVHDPDQVILEWGDATFLLQRVQARAAKES